MYKYSRLQYEGRGIALRHYPKCECGESPEAHARRRQRFSDNHGSSSQSRPHSVLGPVPILPDPAVLTSLSEDRLSAFASPQSNNPPTHAPVVQREPVSQRAKPCRAQAVVPPRAVQVHQSLNTTPPFSLLLLPPPTFRPGNQQSSRSSTPCEEAPYSLGQGPLQQNIPEVMVAAAAIEAPISGSSLEKKPIKFSNLLLGAGLNLFEVTTLGQPLEVVKTTMAANRGDGFSTALGRIWGRGGPLGFYQGLIPWAWIEASTKGAVLLFVASEAEYYARYMGASEFGGGILGGITGGVAQAYATMGFCTCMKTVEITQHKLAASGVKPPSTFQTFMSIYNKEGIRGINKGVNAVAIRQMTNWGSRFGLSRLAEGWIRSATGKQQSDKLSPGEKILASALGGGLSAWNQPIEVIRVEMQSKKDDPNRPKKMTVGNTFRYIYDNNGIKGLYRGVTPRIGLGVWQTICMVAVGDMAKTYVEKLTGDKVTAKH
ncbi:mitochondrial carrier domain-containing protein [Trichoderma asperelloides]|nr:mitochondrial carrier domain-containing protein [Trichoderma asperelloides]